MQLDFVAQSAGRFEYKLYFICDSYLGADQEFDFSVKVEGKLFVYKKSKVNLGVSNLDPF